MTSTASYPASVEAAPARRPRLPVHALLAAYWAFMFIRNGFTETDKDPFYIAAYTAPLFQFVGQGLLLLMGMICILEAPRLMLRRFLLQYCAIAAMLALFSLSLAANDQSLLNAFQFLFGYLQYAILIPFTVLVIQDRGIDFRSVTKWVLIPILIQFALNLGWLLKISPLQNQRRYIPNNVDWAYGTLLNTTEAAGIGSILIFFAFHVLVFRPSYAAAWKRRNVLGIFAAGAGLMLFADSKLTYGTVALALGLISLFTLRAGIVQKLAMTFCGFILVAALFLGSIYYNRIFNPIYSSAISYSTQVDFVIWGTLRGLNRNPKIEAYRDISERLPEQLFAPSLGGGPGNATSRFAIKAETPIAGRYMIPRIDYELRHGNSMLLLPNTGFNAILGDLGWVGVLLFYSTFLLPLRTIYREFKLKRYQGLEESWAFVYMVFAAYFAIHSLIEDKLYLGSEPAFLWIMGVLLRQQRESADARHLA